jgi:hypothetical protein
MAALGGGRHPQEGILGWEQNIRSLILYTRDRAESSGIFREFLRRTDDEED